MVVLHVTTGLGDGGAEAALFRVCTSDRQNRHVVVSLMDSGKYGDQLRDSGVELYCLNSPRGKISLRRIWNLYGIFRRVKPDITQTWMYHANLVGGLASYVAGCKNICWSIRHVDLSIDDSRFTTRMVDKLSAAISHIVPRKIIAISNRVKTAHLAKGYASRFVVIYNGCDPDVFSPKSTCDSGPKFSFQGASDLPTIGCVARWTPEKDHATFLAAIAQISHETAFRVLLVGSGCDEENRDLVNLIDRLGIGQRIILCGPRTDIPDIMNVLDILVLPSKNEAFGNVLIEAMACGTPCIATDVGDATHIVGCSGWIVDRGDPAKMAAAIVSAINLLSDHGEWRTRQQRARDRVLNEFSLCRMVFEYDRTWRSLAVG